MIKFRTNGMIGLGLTKENLRRLQEGSPIMIKGSAIKIQDNIFICYGKTELDILNQLKKASLVDEKTQIKIDDTEH